MLLIANQTILVLFSANCRAQLWLVFEHFYYLLADGLELLHIYQLNLQYSVTSTNLRLADLNTFL
jgi:hypothetical protein